MLLDTVSRALKVSLGEAITTTGLTYAIDVTTTTYPDQKIATEILGGIPAAALMVMVGAPAANVRINIDEINIYNADSVTHNVIIAIYDGASAFVIFKATLTTGQTLHYNEYFGWTIN